MTTIRLGPRQAEALRLQADHAAWLLEGTDPTDYDDEDRQLRALAGVEVAGMNLALPRDTTDLAAGLLWRINVLDEMSRDFGFDACERKHSALDRDALTRLGGKVLAVADEKAMANMAG
jgi:hypothetical protein